MEEQERRARWMEDDLLMQKDEYDEAVQVLGVVRADLVQLLAHDSRDTCHLGVQTDLNLRCDPPHPPPPTTPPLVPPTESIHEALRVVPDVKPSFPLLCSCGLTPSPGGSIPHDLHFSAVQRAPSSASRKVRGSGFCALNCHRDGRSKHCTDPTPGTPHC